MSEAKHTPGPWWIEVPHLKTAIRITSDLRNICRLELNRYTENSQMEANATLIAAAPEMFEALNALSIDEENGRVWLSVLGTKVVGIFNDESAIQETTALLLLKAYRDTAIAKAKGESQ